MQKFKVNGQSFPKIEWKQTDGRTDGRTEATALPPLLLRSVISFSVADRGDRGSVFKGPEWSGGLSQLRVIFLDVREGSGRAN